MGELYRRRGGGCGLREREKKMEKVFDVEKRKPWSVAQDEAEVIAV